MIKRGNVGVEDRDERPLPPASKLALRRLPDRSSSLTRSKMITLASTAMPIDRMNPARPGNVSVALQADQEAEQEHDVDAQSDVGDPSG